VNAWLKALLAVTFLSYALLVGLSGDWYQSRQHTDATVNDLPLKFAHIDHKGEQCVSCHHNYQDDTGQGLCLDCHRRDKAIAHLIEAQFHGLCRGCHEKKQQEGEDGGPTRRCGDCHQPDILP
jgi:hypothetical protein